MHLSGVELLLCSSPLVECVVLELFQHCDFRVSMRVRYPWDVVRRVAAANPGDRK